MEEEASDDEIGTLSRAFNRMTSQLGSQRSELLQAYRDVYGRFYGVPDDPSLPRILAGGDG